MNENPAREVFSDLLGYLESLETQTGAIFQFLREKGIATDEQLAPYLEQAGSAASVKWRAVRVRMEHLFALSQVSAESAPKQVSAESAPKQPSAESPAEAEATKESTKKPEAPRKATEVRRGPSEEPTKKREAKAVSDNGQPTNDVATAPTQPSTSSEQKTISSSEKKQSGESEHPDVVQQKAS